ncbi:MAG: 16S rRNA (guanine(527)-N(7))-methyltransferase RsmG [Pseudomonadota bacterium]
MEIGSTEWKRIIRDGAESFDIRLDPQQVEQFSVHAVELIQWTRKINLTAISDPLEIAVKHFLDSLAAAEIIPPGSTMLDIGSGGGFPGIPLKVLIPSVSATLIDASRKKVSFIKHVIRKLGLTGIKALHARARGASIVDFETPGGREDSVDYVFDVVVSRAVTSLENFIQLALPLVALGGSIVALKGKMTEEEADSFRHRFPELPGIPHSGKDTISIDVKTYTLPYLESERSIVTVTRIRESVEPDAT